MAPQTTQAIHSEKEAVAVSDVICHVIFPYQSNLRSSGFMVSVVNGMKQVSKLQCWTAITSVEYPPTTEQSSTPCTVLGPAWHVVGSTKSAQVLNFDNRDFKQQRFMGGHGIGLP